MATQTAINNLVDELVRVYSGHSISFPNGSYPNQCTVPVAGFYTPRITGQPAPSMYRDRADGWGEVFPYQLSSFFSHQPYQPGRAYPKGTIMMWNSPHIAIVMHHDGSNSVTVFQQNADPDGSVCNPANRVINNQFHSCTYVLVPIFEAEAVPVQAAAPTAASYMVTENYPGGRQVRLNKQPTNLWGMNYHFDYMKDHPIEQHNQGEVWTVTNKVHHEDGYDYYRRDGQVDGFNVLDCDDYTPPPPAPVTPPAAPVTVTKAETYEVLTPLMSFTSAVSAQMHSGLSKTLDKGTYYVWGTKDNAKLLGSSNMKQPDPESWVNTDDNVVVPLPPKITTTIHEATSKIPQPAPVIVTPVVSDPPATSNSWKACTPVKVNHYTGQWVPLRYVSTNDIAKDIRSLDGKVPATIQLPAHHKLMIVSTFIGPDGVKYARDEILTESRRYYALRFDDLELYTEPPVLRTFDLNQDGVVNNRDFTDGIQDFIDYGSKYLKPGVDVVARTVRTVTASVSRPNSKPRKFIDGIVAKKKDKV